jgi:hypothetical protein
MSEGKSELAELPDDWWSSDDVATYLGVKASSVRAYVARDQMPAPDRFIGKRRIRLWKPETITSWHESRPRQPANAAAEDQGDV